MLTHSLILIANNAVQTLYIHAFTNVVFLIQIHCNKDVGWYTSVKDAQASVQVTSYGQMDAILEHGCYSIGIKQPVICKSRNEVISLALKMNKEKANKLLKTSYNLEDLQDLESKLVLITGRNAHNRDMVDLFVDVSIKR